MNGKLIGAAYAVCGVVLVGCVTGAVAPKSPVTKRSPALKSRPRSTRRMQTLAAKPAKQGRSKPVHPPIKRLNGCPLWAACCLSSTCRRTHPGRVLWPALATRVTMHSAQAARPTSLTRCYPGLGRPHRPRPPSRADARGAVATLTIYAGEPVSGNAWVAWQRVLQARVREPASIKRPAAVQRACRSHGTYLLQWRMEVGGDLLAPYRWL